MKQCILLSILIMSSPVGFCQDSAVGPILQFDTSTIVDSVSSHSKTTLNYFFTFANTGTIPVIIERATGSDPDFPYYFPKEPVMPGKRDSIGIILVPQQLLVPTLRRQYTVCYNGSQEKRLCLIRVLKNPG
jgi:hypothetical protein